MARHKPESTEQRTPPVPVMERLAQRPQLLPINATAIDRAVATLMLARRMAARGVLPMPGRITSVSLTLNRDENAVVLLVSMSGAADVVVTIDPRTLEEPVNEITDPNASTVVIPRAEFSDDSDPDHTP